MPRKAKPENLDRLFLSRIRLGVMSALLDGEQRDFTFLKKLLNCSDGNLGAHLQKLEQSKMIQSHKKFIDNKPNTSYAITNDGKKKFDEYVKGLANLLGLQG